MLWCPAPYSCTSTEGLRAFTTLQHLQRPGHLGTLNHEVREVSLHEIKMLTKAFCILDLSYCLSLPKRALLATQPQEG